MAASTKAQKAQKGAKAKSKLGSAVPPVSTSWWEREYERGERKSLARIEKQLDGLQKLLKELMAKISTLEGSLGEVKAKVTKAFGEIRAKIDEQSAKIEELTKALEDGEIPAGAQTALDELNAITQQLDDIVPDAPPV